MEIQYLIAYVCYDSPRVVQRGDSLNKAELAKEMSALFYGGGGDEEGNTVTFLDQFINGIYKFNGLFTTSEDPDEEGHIVRSQVAMQLYQSVVDDVIALRHHSHECDPFSVFSPCHTLSSFVF